MPCCIFKGMNTTTIITHCCCPHYSGLYGTMLQSQSITQCNSRYIRRMMCLCSPYNMMGDPTHQIISFILLILFSLSLLFLLLLLLRLLLLQLLLNFQITKLRLLQIIHTQCLHNSIMSLIFKLCNRFHILTSSACRKHCST